MTKRDEALDYHARGRPGKIAVVPTKPLNNQRDLALAYSPGVAEPCLAIKDNPEDVYKYTAKGNLVAVVTNGTAVLGLGNIGAMAGKPVMEGKGNLFKQFADIDVFDLEVGSEDPNDVVKFCQLLEPTVGGINLEDIRAPDCFLTTVVEIVAKGWTDLRLEFDRCKQFLVMDDNQVPLFLGSKPTGQFDPFVEPNALGRDLGVSEELTHKSHETVHLLATSDRATSAAVAILGVDLST